MTEQVKKSSAPMGWAFAVLFVAAIWAVACSTRSGDASVMTGWADGIEQGKALAQEADKPMIVLFTAGWCPPCQQLKKNVLTQGEVDAALRAGFVPVQVDLTDSSPSNPNLATAQRYGVQGIPAVIAMNADGEPIEAYRGGPAQASFIDWLSRMAE